MSEVDRHNRNLRPILELIISDAGRPVAEADAMVLLESVVTGVMKFYRPNPRHAGEYLDMLTSAVIERLCK